MGLEARYVRSLYRRPARSLLTALAPSSAGLPRLFAILSSRCNQSWSSVDHRRQGANTMKCGTKSVIPYEMRGTARSKWSIAGGHVRRHDRRIVDGGFGVAGIH